MGALAGLDQRSEVERAVADLMQEAELMYTIDSPTWEGGDAEMGAFYAPRLLAQSSPLTAEKVHSVEPFGPVTTLLPYDIWTTPSLLFTKEKGRFAVALLQVTKRGAEVRDGGGDPPRTHPCFRCVLCQGEHGTRKPHAAAGPRWPGRAGGGEEMGGLRGLHHYLQRTAIQGHPDTITAITGRHQPGAARPEAPCIPSVSISRISRSA